jgi:predicted DNA binding protein
VVVSDPQFDGSSREDGVGSHDVRTSPASTTPRTSDDDSPAVNDDRSVQVLDVIADAAEQFRAATTPEQFGQVAEETIRRVLGVEVVCLRAYDEQTNELHTVARSRAASTLVGETAGLDLDRSRAGRAYRAGEIVDDADLPSALSARELDGTGVHAPVDDWGVVSVAVPVTAAIPDSTRRTLDALCRSLSVEARRLEERTERDRRHYTNRREADRCERVRRVQQSVQAATEASLCSESPSTAAETAVEALVDAPGLHAARVVEHGSGGVEVVAASTDTDPVVERVTDSRHSLRNSRYTGRVDTTETVSRIHHPDPMTRSEQVLSAPVRSLTLATPLGDDGSSDALLLTVDRELARPTVEASVASLGRVLGETLSAKRVADLVAADRVVELTFEVTSDDCLAVAVSNRLHCDCAVRRIVPREDGRVVSYLRVEGADTERAVTAATELPGTVTATLVEETPTECRVEVIRESSAASGLLSAGGSARAATASDGVGELVVEAPQTANLNALVDEYTSTTGATLVSKKTVAQSSGPSLEVTDDAELTDRQREVVRAAAGAGYYEWPRERTAEEVAATLDISVSTLSEHLRTAHRRIVETYLETSRDT